MIRIDPLAYDDEVLAELDTPSGVMTITRGIGSGLTTDAAGRIWAVGDRGPNLKVKLAVERYGLAHLAEHADADGAKVMPRLDLGPALSELALEGDRVRLVRSLPLRGGDGRAISGVPTPGGVNLASEPALGLDGRALPPDPSGADTEGVASLRDGRFWVGDEYGPSLLRVSADGMVEARWVPAGGEAQFAGATHPIEGRLPALAARRRLNRGFEALATSGDGRWLFLAFQSPLSHPDDATHGWTRHVRLWRLDAETGAVAAQHLYPLDPPESFARDRAQGAFDREDVKVSELVWLADDRLLVLERGSWTTKLYVVAPDRRTALDPAHLDVATRPTVEELSADGTFRLPVLAKRLVLSSDDHPALGADLEGVARIGPDALLIVNDNDFGTEGAATRFWRVTLPPGWADQPSAG